jgi:hypothetical protein
MTSALRLKTAPTNFFFTFLPISGGGFKIRQPEGAIILISPPQKTRFCQAFPEKPQKPIYK